MEVWKTIKGFENYQVSSYGNVRSIDRLVPHRTSGELMLKGKLIKPYKTNSGYISVKLYKNSKQKSFLVHRLIALYFIENIKKKSYVNHLDGIKTNNKIENLEWVTNSENHIHAYELGLKLRGEKCNMSKLTEEQVIQIRLLNGMTHLEISNIYNVSRRCIGKILNRETWKHV